jgi:hypothetical protein
MLVEHPGDCFEDSGERMSVRTLRGCRSSAPGRTGGECTFTQVRPLFFCLPC